MFKLRSNNFGECRKNVLYEQKYFEPKSSTFNEGNLSIVVNFFIN
jgi:hypothetical protein